MTALDDLRTLLMTYTQMYRPGEVETVEEKGSVRVVTINTYPSKDQAPNQAEVADLLLTYVGPKPDSPLPDRDAFLMLLREALGEAIGEFAAMTTQDFVGGPSYITLGGWLGSQDLALRLIGLGKILGLWDVASGLAFGMDREQAIGLAGGGFVMPVPNQECRAVLTGSGSG